MENVRFSNFISNVLQTKRTQLKKPLGYKKWLFLELN